MTKTVSDAAAARVSSTAKAIPIGSTAPVPTELDKIDRRPICLLQAHEGFRLWVSQRPETIGVFITSGAQDFLIHIAVPDIDGLYAFVIDRLTARDEWPTSRPASSTTTCARPASNHRRLPGTLIPATHPRPGQ